MLCQRLATLHEGPYTWSNVLLVIGIWLSCGWLLNWTKSLQHFDRSFTDLSCWFGLIRRGTQVKTAAIALNDSGRDERVLFILLTCTREWLAWTRGPVDPRTRLLTSPMIQLSADCETIEVWHHPEALTFRFRFIMVSHDVWIWSIVNFRRGMHNHMMFRQQSVWVEF